jgi:hypothetical protein
VLAVSSSDATRLAANFSLDANSRHQQMLMVLCFKQFHLAKCLLFHALGSAVAINICFVLRTTSDVNCTCTYTCICVHIAHISCLMRSVCNIHLAECLPFTVLMPPDWPQRLEVATTHRSSLRSQNIWPTTMADNDNFTSAWMPTAGISKC